MAVDGQWIFCSTCKLWNCASGRKNWVQEANAIFWRHLKFIHMLHKKRRINCAHIQASFYPESMLFFVPTDAIPPIKARSVFCGCCLGSWPWVHARGLADMSFLCVGEWRKLGSGSRSPQVSWAVGRPSPDNLTVLNCFVWKHKLFAPRAQAADDANEHLDPGLGKGRRYKRLMIFFTDSQIIVDLISILKLLTVSKMRITNLLNLFFYNSKSSLEYLFENSWQI